MNAKSLLIVPLVCALSSAPLGMAQTTGGSAPATAANTQNDDKAVENLLAAAQRLREAIQVMAQAPAGPKRSEAIRQGNEALIAVQSATANLPANLLLANAQESDYQKAMDKLQKSAQRLRDAAQALAGEPAGKRRNETIAQINRALLETNQVMLNIPASSK